LLLLTVTWMSGRAAAIFLIVLRLFQAVGAAMLMSNSAAILTDAFPERQRRMAMGINQAAAFSGTFIGLALGGILAPVNWRLVFLVPVPVGLFATVLGYLKLRELNPRQSASMDWPGNISFAAGLVLIMIGITYGIEPYGNSALGWTNPVVLGCLGAGVALMALFGFIESRAAHPMVRLRPPPGSGARTSPRAAPGEMARAQPNSRCPPRNWTPCYFVTAQLQRSRLQWGCNRALMRRIFARLACFRRLRFQ
jgi:MFS family permease